MIMSIILRVECWRPSVFEITLSNFFPDSKNNNHYKNFRKIRILKNTSFNMLFYFVKIKLHQFKSIWCLSGKYFAFFFNPPCQIQPSKLFFASWILLVLHSPFTYSFYDMEDKMHHPYVMWWNAALQCLFLQKNTLHGTKKVNILWGRYDLQLPGPSWWDGIDSYLETQYTYFLSI